MSLKEPVMAGKTARAAADKASAQAAGNDAGLRIVAEMLAGLLLYGGLGWLGDYFWKTNFLLPTGLLVGFALSIYLVIKRYGGGER